MKEKSDLVNFNDKKNKNPQDGSFSNRSLLNPSMNHFRNSNNQMKRMSNSSSFTKNGINRNRLNPLGKKKSNLSQEAETDQKNSDNGKKENQNKKTSSFTSNLSSTSFGAYDEESGTVSLGVADKLKQMAMKKVKVMLIAALPHLIFPLIILAVVAIFISIIPSIVGSAFGIFETTNNNISGSGDSKYLSFSNQEDEQKYYDKIKEVKDKYPGVDVDLITASLFAQNYAPDFIDKEKDSGSFTDPTEEEQEEEDSSFDVKKTIKKIETLAKWQKKDGYNYIRSGSSSSANSSTSSSAGMSGNKIIDPIEWLLSKIPNSVITRGPSNEPGGDHAYDIGVSGDVPGADIPSTVAGTVIRSGGNEVGYSESYGHFVAILDSNGIEHRFAHMIAGSVTVKNGDTVEVGQILGQMGSTGNSTGTHLHYEVDKDNFAIDPKAYFKDGSIVFLNEGDGTNGSTKVPNTTSNSFYRTVMSLEEFKQTNFYQKLISDFIPDYYKQYLSDVDGIEKTKKIEELAETIFSFYETYKNSLLAQSDRTGKSCSYQMGNDNIANLKVRLLQCGTNEGTPIEGEGLIDFEEYIAGVVYQEYGGGEIETLKAQAIAARNFALTRASRMGGAGGIKLELENGQWVLSIRSCTNDQAYCSIERGCWSDVAGGESSSTIYQGYDSSKNWSRPPLSQQSEAFQTQFKTALEAVRGQVMLDQNGEIMAVGYSGEFQLEFNRLAQQGYSYEEILKNRYGNPAVTGYRDDDKLFTTLTSNCSASTAVVDDGEIWSQQDPRWGSMLIGNRTIHDVGCAATSVAMALRRTGAPLKIPDFNPGTFVTRMKEIGGFDGNAIYWSKAVDSRISDELEYQDCSNAGTNSNSFANLINNGWAIVSEVNWNDGFHYIFIDRVENNTIYMLDSSAMAWGDTGPVAVNTRYTMTGFNLCYRRRQS